MKTKKLTSDSVIILGPPSNGQGRMTAYAVLTVEHTLEKNKVSKIWHFVTDIVNMLNTGGIRKYTSLCE